MSENNNSWALTDADETLWKMTFLYDEASQKVAELVAEQGVDLDQSEILKWMNFYDVEQTKKFGYSMHRFPQTLRDTTIHFLGETQLAFTALGIGYNVYLRKAILRDDCLSFLSGLKQRGFKICVVTAGEQVVQNKRLQEFEGLHFFDQIRIVPHKNKQIFETIIQELNIDCKNSFMVGDSLRSDIVPAIQAGLNAFHLNVYNWSAWEIADHSLPEKAHSVNSLTEVLSYLGEGKVAKVITKDINTELVII